VLCHEEYCPYARDYYAKLHSSQIVRQIRHDATTLLPDSIFAAARHAEVCPFEVSLELAREAQVVVCDYNYVFDPYVGLTEFAADNDLSDVILVVDEAHNLVERGRGYYSPGLATKAASRAAEGVAGQAPVERRIRALAHRLTALVESTTTSALDDVAGDARAAEIALPEDDLFALRADFDEVFIDYLEHRRGTSTFRANDPFVSLYFDLLRFLNGMLVADGPAFSRYAERDGDGAALRILCKDPSRQLGELIRRTHSVIGLSATLSPIAFYRDLLGFDRDRFEHVTLPSPFPAENRRLVIDDSVATTWRRRPENYAPIARRLGEFAANVPGNCLALFPSYQFLGEVGRHLRVPGKRVMIQSRADGDRERELLLEALRGSLAGDVLLLAVAGGVFAEGVDYPGDMLKAVAVVGPCLPAVSLERELLKRYYEEQFERGFEYAFVVPGMTRVVQAVLGSAALVAVAFNRHDPGRVRAEHRGVLVQRGPRGIIQFLAVVQEEHRLQRRVPVDVVHGHRVIRIRRDRCGRGLERHAGRIVRRRGRRRDAARSRARRRKRIGTGRGRRRRRLLGAGRRQRERERHRTQLYTVTSKGSQVSHRSFLVRTQDRIQGLCLSARACGTSSDSSSCRRWSPGAGCVPCGR
jgi:DNA excision repair protein ERCC-2